MSEVHKNMCQDILDEEYQHYLELTYEIMKTFKRNKDRDICCKIIERCSALDAENIEVKLNRNEFYKYFLKLLQVTASSQPEQYDKWYKKQNDKTNAVIKDKESSFWSKDKRSYVAAKAIPGVGTLVYLAVAYQPELGWQANGFNSYEF